MYTAFYGLFEKPFSLSPDPRFLFFAESHREALAHLRYGISQGEGFIAVTGEVGTGKSTLCRALIEGLGPDTDVAFLFNPPRSATELLQAIAHEYGLDSSDDRRHTLNNQLNEFLLDRKRRGRQVLLVIDEAQNLDAPVLEEIRLLSNLETASSKLIQIVLLGQPELDRKLDSHELRQLRQRISVRWFLTPLSRIETSAYVAHRLYVSAGGKRPIFTAPGLRAIFRYSGGVPRRINLLADRSLLAGYGACVLRIGPGIVRRAAREIDGGGYFRNLRRTYRVSGRIAMALGLLTLVGVMGSRVGQFDSLPRQAANGPVPQPVLASVSAQRAEPFGELIVPDSLEPLTLSNPHVEIHSDPEGLRGRASMTASARPTDSPGSVGTLEPGPAGTRDEGLNDSQNPGNFLGRLLDQQDDATGREIALNAILDSFGLLPALNVPVDEEGTVVYLERRGLSVFRIQQATLNELRMLNHPVMLSLRTDTDRRRSVALRYLDGDSALLFGVTERDSLEVPLVEIETQWDGEALIVWETFEPLPTILHVGQRGESVVWLQRALAELGLYAGATTGLFDDLTQESVRKLQVDTLLVPDGSVGPRTQMVLYSRLTRYRGPRLQRPGGAG